MVATQEQALIPQVPPTWEYRIVSLDKLPADDAPCFIGAVPDKDLRDSIKQLGVLTPVNLRPVGESYVIEDGHRRIRSARIAAMKEIPAMVMTADGDLSVGVVGIISNETRSENLYGELRSIEGLLKEGFSLEALTQPPFSIPKRRLDHIVQFTGLIDPLRQAWADGRMAKTVAAAAVKLPRAEQEELVRVLQENGKLTATDVRAIREVQKGQVVQQFDLSLGVWTPKVNEWTAARDIVMEVFNGAVEGGSVKEGTAAPEVLTDLATVGAQLMAHIDDEKVQPGPLTMLVSEYNVRIADATASPALMRVCAACTVALAAIGIIEHA